MKYRIFGKDGVTPIELKKLIEDWKVIPLNPLYVTRKKVKKQVLKTVTN